MMKRSVAAVALLAGLGVPAVAHATPQGAVDDVKLAWADGKIKVSWSETAAGIPNWVYLAIPGKASKLLGTTTGAGANELLVPPSALEPTHDPAGTARIIVSDPSTDPAYSATFDRYIQGPTHLAPIMTGTGVLNWQFAPDPAVDTTPKDPLDVAAPVRFVPRLTLGKTPGTTNECEKVALPATTNPYGTVPKQFRPFTLDLYNVSEWGESKLAIVRTRTSSTTFTTPASTTLGATITMSGSIQLDTLRNPAVGDCEDINETAALGGHEMVLHARHNGGAWYVVGVSKTDAKGKYTFVVRNPGTREYRAVLKTEAGGGFANNQSISAQKVVRASTQFVQAKFITPVIKLGQQPNAYVWVEPARAQKAALQFKNAGGVWQGLMYKTLSSGRGLSGPFAFNRVGQTQFRWWVPASVNGAGLPVDAAYSNPFTLTVNR
ncbi:MAG TPA: hypothetical protein VFG33_02140 [Kribbella sp.]|uniref:hypothetical protein n=1 Tax=Kribbella sp. TaxID=1871183 RepID=UPI002D76826E|nr:hypothetical protein [Kribbella sp.]HET6292136.1 hypothetical protein [Kribbella sp.]